MLIGCGASAPCPNYAGWVELSGGAGARTTGVFPSEIAVRPRQFRVSGAVGRCSREGVRRA